MRSRKLSGTRIVIRPLRISDYQNMIECWNKSELPIKIKGRESKASMEKEMQNEGALFIGAFDGEELVGLVIANFDGRRGWINRLAVLPKHRKHGFATELITEAEAFLRGKGATVISALVSRPNTPSRRLFEKNGYKNEEDILYYAKRESPEA
ncbi:MAG: GNAT family N-acetyltransferase [Promethearchaeati archaeon SRVP18_Atabeyarchaeia-1]